VYISYPLDEEKQARLAHELNVINLDVEEQETIYKQINSIRNADIQGYDRQQQEKHVALGQSRSVHGPVP
jgi:exopolyphosphatase/pppGpp-phosphohydrolase